jgi:hypothetical protein
MAKRNGGGGGVLIGALARAAPPAGGSLRGAVCAGRDLQGLGMHITSGRVASGAQPAGPGRRGCAGATRRCVRDARSGARRRGGGAQSSVLFLLALFDCRFLQFLELKCSKVQIAKL